jgi:carboxypeptidase Taq
MHAYRSLEQRFARLDALQNAVGVLQWDVETMMPPGAAGGRAEQLAALKGLAHDMLTAPETADLLNEAAQEVQGLSRWQAANLREMRRAHLHASAVPGELVEASSRAVSRAEMAWREARQNADFPYLLPHLREVLRLQREIGKAKGEALGLTTYDALLDGHDPGLRQADIDPLFAELRAELPSLIDEARARQARHGASDLPRGPFPVEAQHRLGKMLMRAAGFDFDRGRLDISLHPFCGGATDDVRITTRYDEGHFMPALLAVLHETGHALYEQGRPQQWLHQPVGAARGMSLHESQSLAIEMQACRSRAFMEFLAPLVREAFGRDGPGWSADELYRSVTRVEPGLIRVDADEVTYPLHVVLRYDIEKALIADDMPLADLPVAFNAAMKNLLGLDVPDDGVGCLQDIHWPSGAWGYFPTYTLGAIAAAQLFEAACEAEPALMPGLARGDFEPLRRWLRAHVHAQGSLLERDELLAAATGRPLEATTFRRHLRQRYLG